MAVKTTYRYEVYDNIGTYLGVLPYVSNEPEYTQDINTSGCQMMIVVGYDADTSFLPISQLTDESSDNLTDESGNLLTTDVSPSIYQGTLSTSLIAEGNRVVVWEYSSYNVNGIKFFQGEITRTNPRMGENDAIEVTLLSDGQDLDNSVIKGTYALDQTQNASTTNANGGVSNSPDVRMAQSFYTGNQIDVITGLVLKVGGLLDPTTGSSPLTLNVQILAGGDPSMGVTLGATSVSVPAVRNKAPKLQLVQIMFPSPIFLGSNSYFTILLTGGSLPGSSMIQVAQTSTVSYLGGQQYIFNGSWNVLTGSMYFMTLTSNSALQFSNCIYVNQSASAMVTDFTNNYIQGGSRLSIGNIDTNYVAATRNFITNTLTEGYNDCLLLAPGNYYWYADPATSLLYFQQTHSTPDHVFFFKVHINTLSLLATIENIKNAVYLTCGTDINNNRIMVYAENGDSITKYGRRLDRISDSRIIDVQTANVVAANYVAQNGQKQYQATITIFAVNYDISSIHLGDMIGFAGFGTFIDQLMLQVVNVHRSSEFITLTVGTLPLRASTKSDKIQRSLLSDQTADNPSSSF